MEYREAGVKDNKDWKDFKDCKRALSLQSLKSLQSLFLPLQKGRPGRRLPLAHLQPELPSFHLTKQIFDVDPQGGR